MGCCASVKESGHHNVAQPKHAGTNSKKIMSNKNNGIVIGGQGQEQDQRNENAEERRQRMAEAAEQRQAQSKSRGHTQQGLVELQFKEKKLKEAEEYEKKNENYALKWT